MDNQPTPAPAPRPQQPPLRIDQPLKNERGVALMIALFAMMLLTFIAIEVSYDTTVDYVVASQQVNRIRAHYAAKAGLEISLLRIMLYKQAYAALGSSLPEKNMLDPIWNFPFMWPPTALGDKGMTEVDKSMMNSVTKESLMGASYSTTITPEGGRLDINDLGSDIASMKTSMINQIVKLFRAEVEHNEEFADKYSGFRFEEVVNNIADYIDEDRESLNGGDETAPYRDIEDKEIEMPPNRPLRTVDELHQVAGMTQEFYEILAPRITVFGTKGVNINYADKETLMALDPSMTEEAVTKVLERRNDPKLGGHFQSEKDFFGFIQGYGVNYRAIEESKVPLLFDVEFNFRVVSTGLSANVKHEITAITYDYTNLITRYGELLDKQDKENQSGDAGAPAPTTPTPTTLEGQDQSTEKKTKIQAAKGRPTVVYYEEN